MYICTVVLFNSVNVLYVVLLHVCACKPRCHIMNRFGQTYTDCKKLTTYEVLDKQVDWIEYFSCDVSCDKPLAQQVH